MDREGERERAGEREEIDGERERRGGTGLWMRHVYLVAGSQQKVVCFEEVLPSTFIKQSLTH